MFAWTKRIALFLAVNFLVILTVTIILQLLGIQPYLSQRGVDYGTLMIFCLVWGMVGSLISLALSKTMAKMMMGVQVIDPTTRDPQARELLNTIQQLAQKANLPMPEVGIYSSPEVNAFATGATKSGALVAVSSGLLQRMTKEERDGVLGHELTHVANGDMVTMALLQGVVNAFVMFLARAIAIAISRSGDRNSQSTSFFTYTLTVIVLQSIFMLFGSMVVASFSRWREFRADRGGAYLAGKENMIAALECLQRAYTIQDPRNQAEQQQQFQAFKISHPSGVMRLFATHPPLEQRIAALRRMERPSP
ncbi:MAG: protease HtpX [Chlamydiia bacterium]|nr:protease HtpX [Chlamydiia bacterium]